MITRKIKNGELRRAFEIANISFELEIHNLDIEDPIEEYLTKNPKTRFDLYCMEHWASFLDDDSTMLGSIMVTPYEVYFDGNICSMGGVGAVSTLPQYRGMGAVGSCMNKYLNDSYKSGFIFSSLFPFSRCFYQKFGYDIGSNIIVYSIDLRSIKKLKAKGTIEILENGKGLNDVKKVYEDFSLGYNLSSFRKDIDFNWLFDVNSAKQKKYVYLYKNIYGEPKAVMLFEKKASGSSFNMECSHFYFSDQEGLLGLLDFCASFSTYYSKLYFKAPENINIPDMLNDIALYPLERNLHFNGMVRVINVQKVLEMAQYCGTGSIIIKVNDDVILENNKIFNVTFKDKKAISVLTGDYEWDIELSINDFSRFILGTHHINDILFMDSVNIRCDFEKLSQVFYKKPILITEIF